MANPTNYTIGWICAISIEYVAAQTFLDIRHGIPERLSPGDYNNYTLGSIADHNVVIAVLPKGEYGTASAAVVATHMLRSFPNVRIGLMVGIGGGAPSAKNDIRLGDIVVSSPFDGQGGVVQYDFGKAIQGQIFQHTRFLNQPPMILQTAVSGLISQYEIEGHNLHEAVCEVLERKPKLRGKYQRPDLNTDRLYHSNIIHPPDDAQMSNCAVACGNNPSVLISRRDRTDEEDNPRIHYGLVASSNQLMKNALTRDKLAAEKGVLCFEMEAAGLMNHFPCLVIRGICDYSDSHKNDKWQGYAAMAAAAYAKDLLRQIVPSQVEAETKIVDILDGIQGSIDTMSGKVDSIVDIQRDQKQQTIHDWLHPMDYSAQQNDFIASRQEGSGKWLLDSKQFRQWSNQETPVLFCPGIPGAGKTIATSIVINHLQKKFHGRQDVGIAFVYFNFHQHIEHNMIGLFACLLRQLSFQTGSMDEVMSLYSYHKPRRSRPSFQEILDSLKKTITCFSSTFILIDALDECRLPDGVLKLLAEIFELQAIVGFSLFATSRFIPEITSDFERRGASYIEIRASDDDMLSYLNRGLSRLPSFVLRDHELQEKVKSAVTKAADGMFLLAKLHLYSLEDKINPRQLGIALNSLPKGSDAYNQVYEDAMDRIQSQRQGLRDLSFQVIAWIVHAQRPLTRSEMQHALATTNDALLLDLDNITEVELLVSVCAGLVTVDVTSNTIRLVHHTAAEYFDRTRARWFPNAQDDIAHTCVTYLSFQPFEGGPSPTPKDFKARLQTNALYEYAARFWGYHAHNSSIQGSKSILDFLKSTSKVYACSQAMIYTELGYYEDIEMNGVHLAARFGLCKCMLALLERQHDVNCKDKSFGRAPLSWAIESGYGPVVEVLLDHNADVHTKDKSGRTPLIWASEKGFEAIVRLLLDKNADVRPKDRDFGRTSLLWAAKNGHEAVVRLLLGKSAKNVNSRDKSGRTALSWAARNGHSVVVKLLLENGADTELRDEFNRTPLCWAAMNGYSEVVTLLLDKRASTEEVDQFGRTPLFWASMNGHLVVVELLLHSNADFAYRDGFGRTSLSRALEKKHAEVAKLILQKSVAVSYKDRTGRTLLSSAAEYGDNAVVKFMLKNNTAVDSADQDGRTPLSWAAAKGNLSTVKALLASNADPRRGDIFGRTPHAWAAFQDEKAVADLLYCEEFHRQSLEETSDRGLSNGPCDICQRTPIRVSNLYWQFQGIFT